MRNVVSLILGGGKGTRLYPLTAYRSKPAVPLAGKYRLIDIPISNCLNDGMNRIYLLTQFLSASLHRHIRQTYQFDPFSGGFVEILAAQQTLEAGTDWYEGTADAVRKNLDIIKRQRNCDYVLVLSGDQLYRMNYTDMVRHHEETNADVSIAALPVDEQQAAAFGIMRLEDDGQVAGFLEKPKTREELDLVRTDPEWIESQGVESRGRTCLGSMGIYLFNRDTLIDLLEKTDYEDFGKGVFPAAIRTRNVQTYLFDGYWEDIGTIGAFYEANLALCDPNPPVAFDLRESPIYTRPRYLAPTRIDGATITHSLIADGCQIEEGSVIENSLVGLRCRIGKNVTIRNSVLMGADFFETDEERSRDRERGEPILGIGDGTTIEQAIVDKNCRIGKNVTVKLPDDFPEEGEHDPIVVRDRVIVVPKASTLHDGWTFG